MRGKRSGSFSPGRDDDNDGVDDKAWLGTYGDAITLLMAFFVMLYAMSEVDAAKFEAFIRGLQDPFGNTAAEQGMLPQSQGVVGDAGQTTPNLAAEIDMALQTMPNSAGSPDTGPPPPAGEDGQPDDDLPPDDQLDQLEEVRKAVLASLEAAGLQTFASFRYDGRGLVISVATDNVLFDTGSTDISSRGEQVIAAVAEPLERFGNDVFVEGHTDNVPLERPGYSNWNLSTDRAVAVVDTLTDTHDLNPDRLGAAGYAEYRPVEPNDTAPGRAANRRVDILVVAQAGETNG